MYAIHTAGQIHMPCTVAGCHLLCSSLCLARGLCYNSLYRPTIGYFQHFGTCITNAYSTHFVKSSGLNAEAKFHYIHMVGQNHMCTLYIRSNWQGSHEIYGHIQCTVGSRSLRDHTFQKLIKFSILVREGVWGLIFEFESVRAGPVKN